MLQVFQTVQLLVQAYTEDPPSDAHYLEMTEAETLAYVRKPGAAVVVRRYTKDIPTVLWTDPGGTWSRALNEDAGVAKYSNVKYALSDLVHAPHTDTVI